MIKYDIDVEKAEEQILRLRELLWEEFPNKQGAMIFGPNECLESCVDSIKELLSDK